MGGAIIVYICVCVLGGCLHRPEEGFRYVELELRQCEPPDVVLRTELGSSARSAGASEPSLQLPTRDS